MILNLSDFRLPARRLLPMFAHVVAALLVSGIAASANAADRVLILGISQYDAPTNSLAGVHYDVQNARTLATLLGFATNSVSEYSNDALRRADFMRRLNDFSGTVQSGDRVFVYFSGHGSSKLILGQCRYGILTSDNEFIVRDEFQSALSALTSKATEVVLMMDSCHSGGVTQLSRGAGRGGSTSLISAKASPPVGGGQCELPSNMETRGSFTAPYLANAPFLGKNVVFLSASKDTEHALDETSAGGFATNALIECLQGGVPAKANGSLATYGDLAQCASDVVARRVGQRQLPTENGFWKPHTLTVSGGNAQKPILSAKIADVPPSVAAQSSNPTTSTSSSLRVRDRDCAGNPFPNLPPNPTEYGRAVKLMEAYAANSNGQWNFSVDAPTQVAFCTNFNVMFKANSGGYFYVLNAAEDGLQLQQVYPANPKARRYSPNAQGVIGGLNEQGGLVSMNLMLNPDRPENTFLAIISQAPLDFSDFFTTNAEGGSGIPLGDSASSKAQKLACELANAAGCTQKKRSAVSSETVAGSGTQQGSITGYSAAMFTIRGTE
jgi:hypothetical protein